MASLMQPQANQALKREIVREKLNRDYGELLLSYPRLVLFLPAPTQVCSKRSWERQMFHCRQVFRLVQEVEDTGKRSSLYNYVLRKYKALLEVHPESRDRLPDPASDIVDGEWISGTVSFLLHLQGVAESQVEA